MYSYLCDRCGHENISSTRLPIGGKLFQPCDNCGHPHQTRAICRLNTTLSLPEHFNTSTGKYVTNRRDFADQLKYKSDEMSDRTGMDHNYVPVDPHDAKAVGVDD